MCNPSYGPAFMDIDSETPVVSKMNQDMPYLTHLIHYAKITVREMTIRRPSHLTMTSILDAISFGSTRLRDLFLSTYLII